ncbi:MAG: insulinase family protein [Bacteroidetes bacterium]|nr:insulinase family protein [Bacteroidota bacterium]
MLKYPMDSNSSHTILNITFLSLIISLLHCQQVNAQSSFGPGHPFYVEEYKLDNGLTVYLNEDHTIPFVFGAVVVKSGSRRDPPDATGIAHYLEHMMFKGTDKIGTINYTEEKVYLDSISDAYDSLGKTGDVKQREAIQKHINRLSIKAGKYVIQDDLDNLLNRIGSIDVNAYTTEDYIVYHNIFPGDQINKWLEIYSHRFINPVFRTFQSELEVVYEEKNMFADDVCTQIDEAFYRHFYKSHPYGSETVLGRTEHLKSPSLSKMYEYFRTYYVANNMALVISGDFSIGAVKPLIREKFGRWKTGEIPAVSEYKEDTFSSRIKVSERISPMRIGMLGFRTVPKGHPDELTLDVCNRLLSNESQTGLLDELYLGNRVAEIRSYSETLSEAGATIIYFIPKLIGMSFHKAEKQIITQLSKLKNGEFSDDALRAVKTTMHREYGKNLETVSEYDYETGDYYGRPYLIIDAYISGKSWKEFCEYGNRIDSVTIEDIIKTSAKYFTGNYLAFYSRIGFNKTKKLEKPPYDPVVTANEHITSVFAESLAGIKVKEPEPKFIDLKKDVEICDIRDGLHLYYTCNPLNDIFRMKIRYGIGAYEYPVLEQAAQYFGIAGTEDMSWLEFSGRVKMLGSNLKIACSGDYFELQITGFDEHLDSTLKLVRKLFTEPAGNEDAIKLMAMNFKKDVSLELTDPYTLAGAALEFALYGDESGYVNRLSGKEIRKLTTDSVISAALMATTYEVSVHYSGRLSPDTVKNIVLGNMLLQECPKKSNSPVEPDRIEYEENTIYLLHVGNALQTHVYLYVQGTTDDDRERAVSKAFSKYFDGLVYNEIRDFRSLAYTAEAEYDCSFRKSNSGYTWAYLSTQADKTIEAIEALTNIFDNMPEYSEQWENLRSYLVRSLNSEAPSFRTISEWAENMILQGYSADPRIRRLGVYGEMSFDDIIGFYKSHIRGKPYLYVIVGDIKRIDADRLLEYGNVIRINDGIVLTY